MSGAIDAVLFDLGGVLTELGGPEYHGPLVGAHDAAEITAIWAACPVVHAYECGDMSPAAFAEAMIRRYRLDLGVDGYLDAYQTWIRGLYPGARELLADVAPGLKRGCLSNMGELHWETQNAAWGYDAMFDVALASYQLGVCKPAPEAFAIAVGRLGVAPERILFLDDNAPNVDAARAFGMQAERVHGPDDARDALGRRGLLAG